MNTLALLHLSDDSKTSIYGYAVFFFLLIMSMHTQASVNKMDYFQRAFMQCESMMQATWPETPLALNALQRKQTKYQAYRQQGLYYRSLSELKKQNYRSKLRGTQNYAEMLNYCDNSLPKKIKQAVNLLKNALTKADQLRKTQHILESKHNKQAFSHAKHAIDEYCASYVRRDVPPYMDVGYSEAA